MGKGMKRFEFGPGEEKLADLTEIVVSLQKFVMQLSQRSEVDAILISLLLDELHDPKDALERWRTKTSDYYPTRAMNHLGNPAMDLPNEELKARISLWTRALEARSAERD